MGHQQLPPAHPPPPAPPPPPPPPLPTAGLNDHHAPFISFNLQPFASSRASSTHPFAPPHPHTPTSSNNSNVSNVSNTGTVGTTDSPSPTPSHLHRNIVLFPPTTTPQTPPITCRALLDTAASHNLISSAKAAEHGLKRRPYRGPPLRLGDDGRLTTPKHVVAGLRWRFHERGGRTTTTTTWTDDFVVVSRMAREDAVVVVGFRRAAEVGVGALEKKGEWFFFFLFLIAFVVGGVGIPGHLQ